MPRDWIGPAAIGTLCLGAVVAALLTVGGPETGRQEQRDKIRIKDVHKMSKFVKCLAEQAEDQQLPDHLPEQQECLSQEFTYKLDPPPRYEKLDANNFRICVTLEQPDRLPNNNTYDYGSSYDPGTQCLQYKHPYP